MLVCLRIVRYLARRLHRRLIGPESTVCLCLKVYTVRRVALHSHRFYITLACECPLLMIVLLHGQKLDFFGNFAHAHLVRSSPNSTASTFPVVLAYTCT